MSCRTTPIAPISRTSPSLFTFTVILFYIASFINVTIAQSNLPRDIQKDLKVTLRNDVRTSNQLNQFLMRCRERLHLDTPKHVILGNSAAGSYFSFDFFHFFFIFFKKFKFNSILFLFLFLFHS